MVFDRNWAVQAAEEAKKRKLQLLNEQAINNNIVPKTNVTPLKYLTPSSNDRGMETIDMAIDAYNKGGITSALGTVLHRLPGDFMSVAKKSLADPVNELISPWINAAADIGKTAITGNAVPEEQKSNILNTNLQNIQKPKLFTGSSSEPKSADFYEDITNIRPTVNKLPTINEIPNAQRDTELGKMNIAANGNTTTYDIGGNPLSYNLSNEDKQIKTNLEKINQMVASGVAVSPEDLRRIEILKMNAGPSRGGIGATPDVYAMAKNRLAEMQPGNIQSNSIQRVGNMDVQFDSTVSPDARARFLENPVEPTAQMNRYDSRQLIQPQQVVQDPQPIMPTNKTNQAMANYNNAMGEWSGRQTAREGQSVTSEINRDKNVIDKETNRINEISTVSQNKLRDIQGQVAQQPPIKENALKPIVVKEYDELGNVTGEKIRMPNAEGTGYVDGMANQTAPKITPDQRTKINAYIKANPNIDKATILQKIANGEF